MAHLGEETEIIFSEAVHMTVLDRESFLDVRCAGREGLRAEIESLLIAYDRSAGFIQPVTVPAYPQARRAPSRVGTGDRVGAFRLVDVLGEGGMGTVFRAERADGEFTQQAAIKFIGSWIRDPAAEGRFRAERQILASLQHPHIVTLIDGGVTPDGQAYLAMEYVDAEPITRYCEVRKLALDGRLRLFCQVCAAVQFAHTRLIVHRDLKPGNIVVTRDGVPKVLDFGVAKLLDPSADAGATRNGLFPGPLTPDYASPEQLRGLPVTTACDVYALGVLLYELLTGSRPYETAGKPVDEMLSLVLETDPPAPSRRRPSLSADLDAIVLKALQKEPERRYASAAGLAEDITRYLEGRAVLAQPGGAIYRARKFVRRHRAGVAAASAAVLSLAAGLGVAVWQAETARTERDRAAWEAAKANQVSAFLGALFTSNAPRQALGRSLTAQELLDRGVERIDRELNGQPELQASMLATIGSVYAEMDLRGQALTLLERSLAIREQLFGREHADVAETLRLLGRLKSRSFSDFRAAESLLKRAVNIQENLGGRDDPSLPPSLSELGLALWRLGKYEEGRAYLRRAVAIEEKRGGPDLPKWLSNLSLLEKVLGDFDAAEKLLRRALDLGVRAAGPGIPVDVTMLNLGLLLRAQEDFEEARTLLEEVNEIQRKTWGTERLHTLGELGNLYFVMGDYGRARDFLDRAIALAPRDRDHHDLPTILTYSGRLFLTEGKPREALPLLERSLRMRERIAGPKHNAVADTLVEIARAKAAIDGVEVAEPILRRALAMQREALIPGHRSLTPTLVTLGEMLLDRGQKSEARDLFREAVNIARSRLPERHSERRRAETALRQTP